LIRVKTLVETPSIDYTDARFAGLRRVICVRPPGGGAKCRPAKPGLIGDEAGGVNAPEAQIS
jgi:hypothetical protein